MDADAPAEAGGDARESAAPRTLSPLGYDLATIGVLWRRDVVRFFRERSRIAGALVQPLIFWLVIGAGMSPTFRLRGATGVGYLDYFYPGVILMVVLFTSIFATMSVIEDRHQGFLQAVLVAPGSRAAVVIGKSLGATTVALVQAALFVALAPFVGFSVGAIDWPLLAVVILCTSLSLSAMGFAVAWWLDSTQGYHVVMSVLLLPLWIVSGAMFPPPRAAWAQTALALDPMAYSVAGIRRALYGGAPPPGTILAGSSVWLELAVTIGCAAVGIAIAIAVCIRRR